METNSGTTTGGLQKHCIVVVAIVANQSAKVCVQHHNCIVLVLVEHDASVLHVASRCFTDVCMLYLYESAEENQLFCFQSELNVRRTLNDKRSNLYIFT